MQQRVKHRRATKAGDLHLTVAFIGDLADGTAITVAAAIAKMPVKPFDYRLDTLGFFEDAGVVWVGGDANVSGKPLDALAARVRRLLDRLMVDYDRRAFVPHVTLLRGASRSDAQRLNASVPPITWTIDSIALYRSGGGRAEANPGSRYARVLD